MSFFQCKQCDMLEHSATSKIHQNFKNHCAGCDSEMPEHSEPLYTSMRGQPPRKPTKGDTLIRYVDGRLVTYDF